LEELITIPLFPLSLVAYPGKPLNLHIFEPRYRQLINDCHAENIRFGIPTFQDGKGLTFGTLMELTEISKLYPDGKMDVKTVGVQPFKVVEYYSILKGKFYPGGEVVMMEYDDLLGKKDLAEEVIGLINELYDLMKVEAATLEWDTNFRIFSVADKLGLSQSQELNLLSIADENERLYFVKKHLQQLLPVVRNTEEMRLRVQANGHFKNIIPPKL